MTQHGILTGMHSVSICSRRRKFLSVLGLFSQRESSGEPAIRRSSYWSPASSHRLSGELFMAQRKAKQQVPEFVRRDGALCATFVNSASIQRPGFATYPEFVAWGLANGALNGGEAARPYPARASDAPRSPSRRSRDAQYRDRGDHALPLPGPFGGRLPMGLGRPGWRRPGPYVVAGGLLRHLRVVLEPTSPGPPMCG